MPDQTIYTADRIFTGEEWLTGYAIITRQNKILDLVPLSDAGTDAVITRYEGAFIAPAFIDLQIYGAFGELLAVHPHAGALRKLTDYCRQGGAAYCQATLATNTKEVFYKGIDAVRDYRQAGGTGVIGLHLEGPWINPLRRGAHVEELIHPPPLPEVKELLEYGKGVITMITLAPEVCTEEVVRLIRSFGIVVSAGHSNATYAEAKAGFAAGITAVTHLYNAMSPLQHRAPGLVGATMDDDRVMASIIPDGHHADFAAVRIAKQVMKERLFAITDAVTTTGEGYYKHQPAGDKYEAAGILSGSALTMSKALQNLVKHAGISVEEALRMCSLYPAQVMALDKELGRIGKGYEASLVVLDQDLQVVQLLN